MEDSFKTNKIAEKMLQLKAEIFKVGGDMQMTVNDLDWYIDLLEQGETASSDLWDLMKRKYSDFSIEDLRKLRDLLGSD